MINRKEKLFMVGIASLILLVLIYKTLVKDNIFVTQKDKIPDIIQEEKEDDIVVETIVIHISGKVSNPGLVELTLGSRLNDAINLAGGLKKDADMDRINLATKLKDEDRIYIPSIGEELEEGNNSIIVSNEDYNGKINISNCTKEDLLKLPGIGEVLADRILEYREVNEFKDINDIKNVSGIGAKKFEGMKDFIITN